MIRAMLSARKSSRAFGRGDTRFLETRREILAYTRETEEETILVVNNLSGKEQSTPNPFPEDNMMVLHAEGFTMDDARQSMKFDPHGFGWFRLLKLPIAQ
jgi:glycosidase